MINRTLIILFILANFTIVEAFSEEKEKTKIISGNISTSLFDDYVYESDTADNGYNKISAEIFMNLRVRLNENFAVRSALQLKDIRKNPLPADYQKSSEFAHQGIILERLALDYNYKDFSFEAGKFIVDFGQAWLWQNGIWGYNFAEDQYRIAEKLGVNASFELGNIKTYGRYIFTLSSFTNDTKNLDNTLITKRDDTANVGGNPGDERGLTSYAMSLDVKYEFSEKEQLSYHFSYLNLAVNRRQSTVTTGNIRDQTGFAANINYKYRFSEVLAADGLLEYISFNNFGGNVYKDTNFIDANLMLNIYQNWRLIITHARKAEIESYANGTNTIFNEISFGYKFNNGLSILLGHRKDIVDNKITAKKNDTVGLVIRYVGAF